MTILNPMGSFTRRCLAFLEASCLGVLLLLTQGCQSGPSHSDDEVPLELKAARMGREAAAKDVERGLVRYNLTDEPSPFDAELRRISSEQYGVTVTFGVRNFGPREIYDEAYLYVVQDYLKTRYGFDPVAKIEENLKKRDH